MGELTFQVSPFAGSLWAAKSVVGPRTLTAVRERLWCNCSPVCVLPAQWLYSGANGQ